MGDDEREGTGKDEEERRRQAAEEVDEPGGRLEWYLERRRDAKGRVPKDLYAKASKQKRAIERKDRKRREAAQDGGKTDEEDPGEKPMPPGGPGAVNWTELGPSPCGNGQATSAPPVSGRTKGIAVGPGGGRVYLGAANGGVWFSDDAGLTWTPLDEYAVSPSQTSGLRADSLAVGHLAVDFGATAATDTIYVGTGEPAAGFAYQGVGAKRSTAGGAPGTWTLEATNLAGNGFYRIAIDPDDATRVYGATSAGLFRRPTSGSAASWTQITSPAFTNANVAVSDVIVAGTGTQRRVYAAFRGDRVYVSADDGGSWTAVAGMTGGSRIVLAASQSDPSVVYALDSGRRLFRLSSGSFVQVTGVPVALFAGGQGTYDIVLGVDPADANTVYFGGDITLDTDWSASLYKGTITSSGGTFTFPFNPANDMSDPANPVTTSTVPTDPTWIGRNVHADVQSFAFARNAADTGFDGTSVWVGTDGGLFHSASSGARGTFNARNTGLAITQLTFLGQRADTDGAMYGGAQDNGNLRFFGEPAWFEAPKGDGGGVAIDPKDGYRVMRQYVRAGLYRATDGGARPGSWSGLTFPPRTSATQVQRDAANAESGATPFYGPIATSPAAAPVIEAAFGTNRLWLTADWGTTWVTLPTGTNPYTPATPNATQDALGNQVTAIAFATADRIYAATRNTVFRFDRSGGTWTQTTLTVAGLPAARFITDIAIEDGAAGRFYIALGGSGVVHCWYFDGTAWQSAGPPVATLDVPANAIVVDPSHTEMVYLGTDVGVFRGERTGTTAWTWTPFSSGLPEAGVWDLQIHDRANLLRASTHGRGAWEIPLELPAGPDPDLYLRADYADTGRIVSGSRYSWINGAQDPTAKGFDVWFWMSADIKVRRSSLTGLPALGSPVDHLDFAQNIGDYRHSTANIETADLSGNNRIFVQVHNRGLTRLPGSQVRVLLMLADASLGLPQLPAGYANKIVTGDTSNWVSGSGWRFADPASPYRLCPRRVDVRNPGVVEWTVDFSGLSLPTGHDHVCAAAFVTTTTAADQITGTTQDMGTLTMSDKHAAFRNLHLVAVGSRPSEPPPPFQQPQVMLVDVHNPFDEERIFDLVFMRRRFKGRIAVIPPRLERDPEWDGWEESVLDEERERVECWLENARREAEGVDEYHSPCLDPERTARETRERIRERLRRVDLRPPLLAPQGRAHVRGVLLKPQEFTTFAMLVSPPDGAKAGDRFDFDVAQVHPATEEPVGGARYVVAVIDPR